MEQLQIQMSQATKSFYSADYEESKIIFEQLLKVYSKKNDTRNVVRCLYRLCCLAYTRGQISQFHALLKKYKEALTEELLALPEHLIEYEMLLAIQALTQLTYSKAIPHFSKVVMLSQNTKYKKQKISALLFIQKCQIILGNAEQAITTSNSIWDDYYDVMKEDTQQYLHYVLNRAYAFMQLNCMEEFEVTIRLCEQHPDFHLLLKEQVFTAILRAKQHAINNHHIQAIKLLKGALAKYEDFQDAEMLYMMFSALIDYYEHIQQHKEALHYAKKLMGLQRSIAMHST